MTGGYPCDNGYAGLESRDTGAARSQREILLLVRVDWRWKTVHHVDVGSNP